MKAILIDDETGNIENLKNLLQKYCPQVEITGTATTITEAFDEIKRNEPDLIFLDIQMGKDSGFDLLRLLPERNFEVIFITAYDQFGVQAIKFAAMDYLLKPIDIPELVGSVQKAEKKIGKEKNHLQLNSLINYLNKSTPKNPKIALPQQKEIRYVSVSDIIRCEAENTYTYFFLQNGERILVCNHLKEYALLLKPYGFIRTHQTHLVNPEFVKSWIKEDGGGLLLEDGAKIPVSKPNKVFVKSALLK